MMMAELKQVFYSLMAGTVSQTVLPYMTSSIISKDPGAKDMIFEKLSWMLDIWMNTFIDHLQKISIDIQIMTTFP